MPQKTKVAFQAVPKEGVSVSDLARKLRAAGAEDVKPLESIGIVTGSLASDQLKKVSKLEGVGAIEEQQQYQLPPSDSEIQ